MSLAVPNETDTVGCLYPGGGHDLSGVARAITIGYRYICVRGSRRFLEQLICGYGFSRRRYPLLHGMYMRSE